MAEGATQPFNQLNQFTMRIHPDDNSFISGYSVGIESDIQTSSSFPSVHSGMSSAMPSFLPSLPSASGRVPPSSGVTSLTAESGSTTPSRRNARSGRRWKAFHIMATCFFLVAAAGWQWAVRNRVSVMQDLLDAAVEAHDEMTARHFGIRSEQTAIVELHHEARNLTLQASRLDHAADSTLRLGLSALTNASHALKATIHDLQEESDELRQARLALTAGAVQGLVGYWFQAAAKFEADRARSEATRAQELWAQAKIDREEASNYLDRSRVEHNMAVEDANRAATTTDDEQQPAQTGVCRWFGGVCDWITGDTRRKREMHDKQLEERSDTMSQAADEAAQAYMEMVESFQLQKRAVDEDKQAWDYEYQCWLTGNSSVHLARDAEYYQQAALVAFNDTLSDVAVAQMDDLDVAKELREYQKDVAEVRLDRTKANTIHKKAVELRQKAQDVKAEAHRHEQKIQEDEIYIRSKKFTMERQVNKSFAVVASCLWFAVIASCMAGIVTLLTLVQIHVLGTTIWKEQNYRAMMRPLVSRLAGSPIGSVVGGYDCDRRQLVRFYTHASYVAAHCFIFLATLGYVSELLIKLDGRLSQGWFATILSFAFIAALVQSVLLHVVAPLVTLSIPCWRALAFDPLPLVSLVCGECILRWVLLFVSFLLEFATVWIVFGDSEMAMSYRAGSTWIMWIGVCVLVASYGYYRAELLRLEEESLLSHHATGGGDGTSDGSRTITTTGSLAAVTASTEHSSLMSGSSPRGQTGSSQVQASTISGFSSWSDFQNLMTVDLGSTSRHPSAGIGSSVAPSNRIIRPSSFQQLEDSLKWSIVWRYEFTKLHLLWNVALLVWSLSILQCDLSLLLFLQPLSMKAPTSESSSGGLLGIHWGHVSFGIVVLTVGAMIGLSQRSRRQSQNSRWSPSETQPLNIGGDGIVSYHHDTDTPKTLA